jgi:glycosyltransferase involved in cell wall biosynthesis
MAKKKIKIIKQKIKTVVDYIAFIIILPLCIVGSLFLLPWILKQRRIWKNTAKGNPTAAFIKAFRIEKTRKRGFAYLLPFQNPMLNRIYFLDATNSQDEDIEIEKDCYISLRKLPSFYDYIVRKGYEVTAIIFRELFAVYTITNFCVEEKIGVLRAYKHNYPALRAYLVSCFIKIPFIVDISGNYALRRITNGKPQYFRTLDRKPIFKFFLPPIANWLYGLPLRHAFHVFGRNKCTYEHAFALGAPLEKLSLLRINNFDAIFNSYDPQKPPPKPGEFPYLLFVGRLSENKLPLDVIEAFDLAAENFPDYHLVIIGDGMIRGDVEQRRERSQYKDRIVLTGRCPSETVFNWTAHAKIVLCPFSGSTLAEAMLCAVPVVAYDVAGHPEIVIDDYTGYLVPFRNVKAMAEKIIYVLQNYDDARIVSKRGRDLARVVFDKDKIWEKEGIYYKQAFTA